MAKSDAAKPNAPQRGYRKAKSGGQTGDSGYNELIREDKMTDPEKRTARKMKK